MLHTTWCLILLTACLRATTTTTLAEVLPGNVFTNAGAIMPPLAIDMVIPVAPKDLTVLRFTLRHALKYAQHLRNIYLVSAPSRQLESVALQTSTHYTTHDQKIVIIDEAKFPFSIRSIRAYLREARPKEGYDGQPFDGVIVTPQKCPESKQAMQQMQLLHACRQRYANETSPEQLGRARWGQIKMDKFDRAGWMFQQFLKLGCNREIIPGLSDAYWVLDSDTIFFNNYSPFPPNSDGNIFNYLPGDGRDCGNPPYYMTLNALQINPEWEGSSYGCVGKGVTRKCRVRQLCPIAHQMIYSQKVHKIVDDIFHLCEKWPDCHIYDFQVLRALHSHLEKIGSGQKWWQTILHEMPAWHTVRLLLITQYPSLQFVVDIPFLCLYVQSPLSEYIIYFAWASSKFPETIVVYNETQLGVTHNEVRLRSLVYALRCSSLLFLYRFRRQIT
jgi:hypothetical protein